MNFVYVNNLLLAFHEEVNANLRDFIDMNAVKKLKKKRFLQRWDIKILHEGEPHTSSG